MTTIFLAKLSFIPTLFIHIVNVTQFNNYFLFEGGDLFERVAAPEYKLTEEKVQIFIGQIIKGLQFIHELNIVHLDIKPYNILFSNKV